jgi:hypothetical protein
MGRGFFLNPRKEVIFLLGFMPIKLFVIIFVAVGFFFLVTWIFQWLWNITMPQVFNLKEITYWQAFRLLIIAGLIFGPLTLI